MQQELRNTGACVMPSISSANMPTSDHPLANTQSQGSERSNTLNSTCYEIPNAQSDKSVQTNATSVQTVKHFEGHMDHNSILSNSNYEPDGANLQCKLTNLDGNCHLNKLHVYGQNTGNRRIVLESATSTGQLATGASVEERHNFEAFHNSRTLVDMSPWMVSSRFFEGEVDATRGHCMPTEGIRNDCEHCSLASNLVSRDSSKSECRQRIPENVTNLVSTDTSVNANLNPQSLIVGGCHGALCRPHDGLKEKERLSAENENSPQQNLEQTRSWQQSGNKPLQSAAEVSKISEQVYNQWNMQEKQQELNTSNGTITVNHGSHCLDEVVNARCLHTQNGTLQRHGAIEGRLNAVNTETCTNSASPAAETHPMEVNEDKDKLVDSLEVHPNVKQVEGRVTIKCNKASVGQLSTTAAAMPRIVMKNCSSSRPSRLKSFPSEATKDHSWVSPVDGTLEQGANPSTLATSSGHLVSVGENESAMLNNFPDRKMKEQSNSLDEPCSALMQWKDSGKIALKGADLVTTCNPEETFPPQEHLEDDLLSDTASKRASAVADTGNLNKQQLLSDLCSKSSENVLSGFSDGEHLMDEDASQGECESKKRVLNDAVDEGSGIGKCCSSNELEPQGTTNLELPSSTSEYAKKEPRSLKCSPIGKTDYFREAKSTRTKHMDSTIQAILRPDSPMRKSDVELFKVERKKRKTMKWKKLDDTMAAAIEVMDVEEVEPVMNVSQSDAVPMKFMEQESTRVSLNVGFSRKRSLMSPNKGMAQKRKQLVHSPGPSFSFMDETKMVDDSDNLSKKMHEKTNNISKMKPDMIISKDPENCAALRTKEVGRVKCIKLRYASSPSKMQGSQRDAEESAKPFIIKPGIPRELLGRLPCETSATTPSKEKLKPSWGAGGPPTFKNSRTFFGRSNPRNARMVSLSSILKLPVEVPKSLSKDGTRVCVKSRIESEDSKGLRSDVVSDAAVFDHEKQGVTSNNKVSNNGIHTLVLPKEARKRSLWELTGREKDCRMATDFVNPNAADMPRATNRPILYVKNSNQATHAEAGHSGESKSIIPRGARSARAHIHVKANGWQSRREDLKPGRVQSPMAASNSRSKLFSKEFVTKVDQSLSNFNLQSVSKLERRENLLVPRFTQVNAGSKNRKRCLGEGTLAIPIASALEKHVNKPLEGIDSQANQQSSPGRDSEAVVVSGPVQPKICKSHTSQLEVDNNHKKKKLKRPFFKDHVDIVARKKRWKRFKASTLRRTKNCCVCGSSESDASNKLVNCSQCSVKVHQCCYGVSKVPKASWLCRACKANVSNIVCVLCGYGGGAMTRAQKTRSAVKGLLQAWRVLVGTDRKLEDLEPDVCKGHENGGTTESWNYKPLSTKDLSDSDRDKFISGVDSAGHKTVEASRSDMQHEKKILKWKSNSSKILDCPSNKFVSPSCDASREGISKAISRKFRLQNTVTAASDDPTVTQWVHMVCALWMPGTRCLNLGTMGVFDVSGITSARKRLVCSICKRQGGSCIQCRVSKCSVPFHVWCAHEKGLLQTEVVDRESGHVGFYGKCMIHGELVNVQDEVVGPVACADKATEFFLEKSSCARTEGYNGRQTLEEKAAFRHQLAICGSAGVSQEQINAWMRINERKTSGRRFIKPPNSDIKIDHREYTRFKQEQGWRRLAVYKSGIHALGLYTAETILKGEMVVEYIGEIVGLRVADKREADYHTGKRMQYKGACYLFRIDKESIIDATRKGGIARFVNHSCLPNCVAKVICVKNQKKVVFFAERDINAGEEITYDYHFNYEKDGDKIPCLCGSEKCRKFLN
ncbi:hypothetical protein O6H91_18G036600 [Diphasiastrum complanatum]|nr:hypothetical protein O6H91_18G036600 [Diphasiastrum complanatum]